MAKKTKNREDNYQPYDEWRPEYTPTTGKLTKRSKEHLQEIRAQELAERFTAQVSFDNIIDGISFLGLVVALKEGFNVLGHALVGWYPGEFIEAGAGVVEEFVAWITGDDGKTEQVKVPVPANMTKEQFERYFALELVELNEKKIKLKESLAGKITAIEKEIDIKLANIETIRAYLYGGTLPDGTIITYEQSIQHHIDTIKPSDQHYENRLATLKRTMKYGEFKITRLQAEIHGGTYQVYTAVQEVFVTVDIGLYQQIENLKLEIVQVQAEIDAAIITRRDLREVERKIQYHAWMAAIGSAGVIRWFLKSYEASEAVENVQL